MNNEILKMMKVISQNDELREYFIKIFNSARKLQEEQKEHISDDIQEIGKKYYESKEKIEGKIITLSELGLKVSFDSEEFLDGYIPVYVDEERRAFERRGHYAYNTNDEYECYQDEEWENEDRVSFPTALNGIKLSKEILQDERENHSSKLEYEKWRDENSDLENEIKSLYEIISADQKKLKYKCIGKDRIKTKLTNNKAKLQELTSKLNEGNQLRLKAEFFENLTEEQIITIKEYFDMIDDINATSIEFKNQITKSIILNRESLRGIKNMESIIDYALTEGIISSEEQEKVDYILTNVDLSNVLIKKYEDRPIFFKEDRYANDVLINLLERHCEKVFEKRVQKNVEQLSEEICPKTKKIKK